MSELDDATPPLTRSAAYYWQEARRPLVSLVFVSPMLVSYELGLIVLSPQAMRNGADVWLRHWLESLGFSQYFLLPLLTCSVLLGWHYVMRYRWRVDHRVLLGMLSESLLFGMLLIVVARLCTSALTSPFWLASVEGLGELGQVVSFFGAGIYEELLFRLLLIPLLAMLLRGVGLSRRTGVIFAVVLSSLLFSAAHYRFEITIEQVQWAVATGDPFEWSSFLFRFTAGVFFSLLLVCRGFGVTAGTHALYDVLVVLI